MSAIDLANSLPTAFQAAVFGINIDEVMHIAGRLDASAVMLNDHTAFRDDVMPFAGLRESGLGVGGIPYTFEDMQVDKLFVIRVGLRSQLRLPAPGRKRHASIAAGSCKHRSRQQVRRTHRHGPAQVPLPTIDKQPVQWLSRR